MIMAAIYVDLLCYALECLFGYKPPDLVQKRRRFLCSLLRTEVSFSVSTRYRNAMDINLVDNLSNMSLFIASSMRPFACDPAFDAIYSIIGNETRAIREEIGYRSF